MPVHSRDLPGPGGSPAPGPDWGESRYWVAGLIGAVILVLALRALFPPTPPTMVLPTSAPTAAMEQPAPPLAVVTWTPAPAESPAPPAAQAAPTPAVTAPGCPASVALAAGARAGWLARAAGCPGLVLANVGGVRQWAQRPADLPDDLFFQLPEVTP